jgi:hypothetical protein
LGICLEVEHIPGLLMTDKRTDILSRGIHFAGGRGGDSSVPQKQKLCASSRPCQQPTLPLNGLTPVPVGSTVILSGPTWMPPHSGPFTMLAVLLLFGFLPQNRYTRSLTLLTMHGRRIPGIWRLSLLYPASSRVTGVENPNTSSKLVFLQRPPFQTTVRIQTYLALCSTYPVMFIPFPFLDGWTFLPSHGGAVASGTGRVRAWAVIKDWCSLPFNTRVFLPPAVLTKMDTFLTLRYHLSCWLHQCW